MGLVLPRALRPFSNTRIEVSPNEHPTKVFVRVWSRDKSDKVGLKNLVRPARSPARDSSCLKRFLPGLCRCLCTFVAVRGFYPTSII